MVIAYDVSYIQKRTAGLGRFSTIILRGLLSHDHQRDYLLHGWSSNLDEETIRSFLQPNVRLSITRMPGFVKRLYWNLLPAPQLETLIGHFDVYHSADPLLPPLGRKRSIITLHDIAFKKFPQYFTRWVGWKWGHLFKRGADKADAVIVSSEYTRGDLIDLMSIPTDKIHVVRPPVDPLFSEGPALSQDVLQAKFSIPGEFILFVGTVEPRKNIPSLVKAYEQFAAKTEKPPSLVIAGRLGWLYEESLKAISISPVRDKIILLHDATDADLCGLYRSAVMLAFPSFYEGHGFPVVEAMASGLPVITSNSSSLKEIGEGAALLVDPYKPAELTEAMHLLYANKGLRHELAAKGLQRAAEFSMENAVEVIQKVYSSFDVG